MRSKKPYHKRKRLPSQIEQLCGEAWPEDGLDPRYDGLGSSHRSFGRKTLQLCSQAREALEFALAAECSDPVLQELSVVAIEPAPHSGRLLVKLQTNYASVSPEEVLEHLRRAAGKLRCLVAAAITRKKAPELAFCLIDSVPRL